MKFISAIALLFSISSASATVYVTKKMSFSPSTFSGGRSQVYYNCDWARTQAKKLLQELGGQDIRVSCSGGIEWRMATPIFMRITVDVPTQTTMTREVTLSGRDSCHFNTEFIDKAVNMFPGVVINSKRASCFGGRLDSWKYELQVSE